MIKKIVVIGLLGLVSLVNAKVNVVVSVLPQVTFVKAIGGENVNVDLMVKPGNSPHTYEPKPSQMKAISNADIYFSIGVEFEKAWLPKFSNQNQNMNIINIGQGVNKMEMMKHEDHDDHEEHQKHGHYHKQASLDPHIWISPDNVRIIAKNILNNLIKIDQKNEESYEENYDVFIQSVNDTDAKIKSILKDIPRGAKFMIFHPSWGYFAKQYCLTQIPIEVEGKTPKPKDIMNLIDEARKENIQAILTAPEFSDKVAKQMAKELNIKVTKIGALNPKWSENLINFAKIISNR